jgi:K+-sensing histidine kinase KdpD
MPHTSTANANKDCQLLVLRRAEMDTLIKGNDKILENLKSLPEDINIVEKPELNLEDLESEIRGAGFLKESDLDFILNENSTTIGKDSLAEGTSFFGGSRAEQQLTDEQLNLIFNEVQSINDKVKPADIIKSIIESAQRLTHAEKSIIYLIDKRKNELNLKALNVKDATEIRLKMGEGIAGVAAQNKEVINISDVQIDNRFNQYLDGVSGIQTRNLLCYPFKDNEEVIGVFYMVNCKYGEFNKIDEKFLEELSVYAVKALKNAEAIERLIQEEKNILLEKMANFLVQEIKKPILVSKRYSEHMKTKNPPAELNQAIDMQLEHMNYIADLIQSTTNYVDGKTALQLTTCKLNIALTEILGKLESNITIRNCHLEIKLDRDTSVQLDKKEFYIVCFHIIRNACDAMPEGGNILVTTKLSFSDVSIFIKDNGPGIPIEIREKIFEPFFTYNKKEGTGLGLTIARSIIEKHGGKITVESNPGEGTTVIITFPIV